jgi:magnesium-protoporphyrin O-methyltransferase
VGGGIGMIQIELLRAGASAAASVEASSAYLQAAREQAAAAGLGDRITYMHGDFVSLAATLPDADIVTLDRVICCYDDVRALVSLSASKAVRFYAAVYPRSTWWARVPVFVENLLCRLRHSPFRAFIHPSELVDRLIREAGLRLVHQRNTFIWQVVVYAR